MGFYDSHNNDKNYSEKRDFIRMKLGAPLSATLTFNQHTYEGVCLDLSGGGMQVEVTTEVASHLPLGTEVEVLLASSHGHNPSLKAWAKITRAGASDNGSYLLGLEIISLLDE